MKCLRKNFILEGQNLSYVKSERDVLIECQSNPFLVQLIIAFQNAERLFFLMEVARAGTIYDLFESRAPRPFRSEQIVFFTGQIACALLFLHSKQIVRLHLSLSLRFSEGFVFLDLSRSETGECLSLSRRECEVGRFWSFQVECLRNTADENDLWHCGIYRL